MPAVAEDCFSLWLRRGWTSQLREGKLRANKNWNRLRVTTHKTLPQKSGKTKLQARQKERRVTCVFLLFETFKNEILLTSQGSTPRTPLLTFDVSAEPS